MVDVARAERAYHSARALDFPTDAPTDMWAMMTRAFEHEFLPETDLVMIEKIERLTADHGIRSKANGGDHRVL